MNGPRLAPPKRYDLVDNFNALTIDGSLPAPPKRYDLVESFNALALAGKQPNDERRLPDASQRGTTFAGGSNTGLLVAPDNTPVIHRSLPTTPIVNRNDRTGAPTLMARSAAVSVPQASKHSLAMQYALKSPMSITPTKPVISPPSVTPQPHSNSYVPRKVGPPLSVVPGLTQPMLKVTPIRTRSVSAPLFSQTPSSDKGLAQCSGTTKADKRCTRQVKVPPTHSRLDPIPVLYCHQHREKMISTQTGFFPRMAGNADKFIEFSDYIPTYLQIDTQLALKVEMEKAISAADVSGYIYTFEIRDPKRSNVIQLKVGRAVNLTKRLDQWDKQCGSKVQIPRGWWPGTVEGDDGSLLKGNFKAGDPGPFCHRVERLVHIELADLSLHAPYLKPGWPRITSDTSTPKKTTAKEAKCLDCGAIHREIFAFPRPENGQYKGREWDLIVKPVIEKWGKFVEECYA